MKSIIQSNKTILRGDQNRSKWQSLNSRSEKTATHQCEKEKIETC